MDGVFGEMTKITNFKKFFRIFFYLLIRYLVEMRRRTIATYILYYYYLWNACG